MEKRGINNFDELEFAVFCVENIAIKLCVSGEVIYRKLTEDSNILYDYIVASYDVLHTQGKDYIVEDIVDTMREKGVL